MDASRPFAEHRVMDLTLMVWVGVVFVLAGAVKGVTGMGLPTVAVSLLGLVMLPAQAAALLVLPSLATNVAQCRGPHARRLVRLLWPLWLGLAVGTVFAPGLGDRASALDGRRLLGVVLVVYGSWGLWRPAVPDASRCGRWAGVAVGLATGAVSALTAVFAVPMVPWLQALKLGKDEMVQALGLSFTVATLALAVRLQAADGLRLWSPPPVLATVAAFAGLAVGGVVRARLSGAAFQRTLFIVFIGLGIGNLLIGG